MMSIWCVTFSLWLQSKFELQWKTVETFSIVIDVACVIINLKLPKRKSKIKFIFEPIGLTCYENSVLMFHFSVISGSPINRLPIMAKSVLDLYELYNLVIARGGLVDVINKKLWQEIIKGLHLPSSITSAAFTLRTQ